MDAKLFFDILMGAAILAGIGAIIKGIYNLAAAQKMKEGIWELDETKEYIICTQEAFPRAGKYSLNLIPTGNKITLSNYQGFEREISTYTILSEKDKAEYDDIGQLKTEYDNLTEEEEFYQREIKRVCEEFTE